MGRRQDPNVDPAGGVRADRPDLPLLDRSQQTGLQVPAHVADLVEQQRSAVGLDEQAAPGSNRPGEGAPDVSEQLALEQGFRDRSAIDRDERPVAPRAGLVDGARQQFLAAAALAQQQDGHVPGRQTPGHADEFVHRAGAPHQTLEGIAFVHLAAQAVDLLAQLALSERTLDDDLEGVGVNRLAQVIGGTRPDGLDRRRNRPVGGDQHDRQIRRLPAQLGQQLDAVHARHDQIRDHQVGIALRNRSSASPAVPAVTIS